MRAASAAQSGMAIKKASAQGNGLRVDSHLPALHERNATVCKYPRNLRVQNGKSVNKYIFQS